MANFWEGGLAKEFRKNRLNSPIFPGAFGAKKEVKKKFSRAFGARFSSTTSLGPSPKNFGIGSAQPQIDSPD